MDLNGIMGISIHISYLQHRDSTLMLSSIIFTYHPFQPSPMSLLRVVLFQSVFLSMLPNYIDWQLSIPNVSEHA